KGCTPYRRRRMTGRRLTMDASPEQSPLKPRNPRAFAALGELFAPLTKFPPTLEIGDAHGQRCVRLMDSICGKCGAKATIGRCDCPVPACRPSSTPRVTPTERPDAVCPRFAAASAP